MTTTPPRQSASVLSTTMLLLVLTKLSSTTSSSAKKASTSSRLKSFPATFLKVTPLLFMYPMTKGISLLREVRLILRSMYGLWKGKKFIRSIPIRFSTMMWGSAWKLLWSGAGPVRLRFSISTLIKLARLKALRRLSRCRSLISRFAPVLTTWPCTDSLFQRSSGLRSGTCTHQTLPNPSSRSHNPTKSTWTKCKTAWCTHWKIKTSA